jgi:hypothetical protein
VAIILGRRESVLMWVGSKGSQLEMEMEMVLFMATTTSMTFPDIAVRFHAVEQLTWKASEIMSAFLPAYLGVVQTYDDV